MHTYVDMALPPYLLSGVVSGEVGGDDGGVGAMLRWHP